MTTQTAIRAETFIQSVGVQLHLRYSDSKYWNVQNVITDLKYLGIDHVRDTIWNTVGANPAEESHYAALAAAGIHFDMLIDGGTIAPQVALLSSFETANPGAITSIEGPNEVDNTPVPYNGLTGTAGDAAYENALVSAVKGTPNLSLIPLYNESSAVGIATNATDSNFHAYPTAGAEPLATLTSDFASSTHAMSSKPVVVTEAGYYTMTDGVGWGGVDYTTQAKLTLNMIMDATKLGVSQIYIYQLLDDYADPNNTTQEDHFGLFDINNNPKPAAVAIHNLMTILADTGPAAMSFTTSTLSYTISGLPSTGSSIELEKSSGAHDIVVWNEPKIWNNTTHTEIAAAATPVTVNLGASFANVTIYDPLSGTGAVSTLHNVSSVTLSLTDHPLIIEVGATGASSATPGMTQTVLPTIPVSSPASSATADFSTPLGLSDAPHGSLSLGLSLHT